MEIQCPSFQALFAFAFFVIMGHGSYPLSETYTQLKLGEVSTVVVSTAEFAEEVMKTHDLIFASRPPILAAKILDQEKFIYVVKEAVKTSSGFALADVFPSVSLLQLLSGMRPKLERLHKEADRIMENIIKEHQRDMVTSKSVDGEAEEDLVDALLKFHEHGSGLEFSLTTDNIKAVIFVSTHTFS
ncbi:unnamed protein product [Prunus armeniaca]|uniref:Uncharacterized protein n=1 Tax=Prunus armeniaca TaxID=36596 RepID=A0A6J5X6Y2_PRUAR|nr:unnamed protein product [Prunus armeniaca]